MNTPLRKLLSILVLIAMTGFSRGASAQIEIGTMMEETISLSGSPQTSLKLTNGAYRNGKFIYASRHYIVIEPTTTVRPDIKKLYGGLAVEWTKIDTMKIRDNDVEIHPEGTTGEAILRALGSIPGASGSSKEATPQFRESQREYLKKNPQPVTDAVVTPIPVAEVIPKPDSPMPIVVETRPDGVPANFTGRPEPQVDFVPATSANAPAPAPVEAASAPAPGPRVLTIPQSEVAPVQEQGFSFTTMSTGQQIGVFVGVIAALVLVIRVL